MVEGAASEVPLRGHAVESLLRWQDAHPGHPGRVDPWPGQGTEEPRLRAQVERVGEVAPGGARVIDDAVRDVVVVHVAVDECRRGAVVPDSARAAVAVVSQAVDRRTGPMRCR